MGSLLKFLIITISILWLIRIAARFLLPFFFQKMVNKVQNQAQQRYNQSQKPTNGSNPSKPDGRIRVEYMPPKEKSRGEDAGDFVEYEEVK